MVEGKINEIHGWAAMKPGIEVEPWSYKPRALGPNDVEVEIQYSGICGSDLHTIKDEWQGTSYPAIVGHEIVGRVITKGEKVTKFAEGDIVGGYASAVRVDANYVFKIPPSIDPALAAPLFCAATTVAAPMLRKGVKKGDRVGVIGIGGLGHLAIQYARALGAEVYAFSHSPNKKQQCLELGASKFVLTSDKEEVKKAHHKLDYLLVTSNSKANQYNEFISWMRYQGVVVILALPEGHMQFSPFEFVLNEVGITGSLIGGHRIIDKVLELAVEHNIRPVIEKYPIDRVNEALKHMEDGKARYRIVLTH
ncbi:hypothetical protein H4R24_000800 [Coemansia sp. RSA 988]|nr:hypothetical protein H4R24_000800 [Coemansia sp. RSA 988]